jgi:hypothetical protein
MQYASSSLHPVITDLKEIASDSLWFMNFSIILNSIIIYRRPMDCRVIVAVASVRAFFLIVSVVAH